MSEYYPLAQPQSGRGRGRKIEFPAGIRNAAIKASRGKCFYCLNTLVDGSTDVDHLIPSSKGGKRERGNAKACCRDCNRGKADMDAVQFQRFRGWIPRCQNIVDEYDCENDAIKKSDWLLCSDCYGGASAGDIALGVGIGVGVLGLAVGAGVLIHELTKERDEEAERRERERKRQNGNNTDECKVS